MMTKCYSMMEKKKFEYCWIIKNVTDYFNFVDCSAFSIYNTFKCRKHMFYLEMAFSSQSISCFLRNFPAVTLECQLSILYKNNKILKTVNVKVDANSADSISSSPLLVVKLNDLLSTAFNLFPDNNLKVLCDFTIFESVTTTSPIYIPKQHKSMKDNFKELLNSQSGSDVTFKVDNQEFKAHRSILMARSPVFEAMFTNDMIEKNSNLIIITDISSSIFKLMIDFIYTDEIDIQLDLETGIDLLTAASKYQLESLEALCEEKLFNLLTVNNVMDTLVIAEALIFTNFIENIKNFIKAQRNEIQSITNRQHFIDHPHHTLLLFPKD